MTRGSALDREKLWWDAVEQASAAESPDEIPEIVLPVLKRVLGADGVGCHWINLREAQDRSHVYPLDHDPRALCPATFETYRRLMHTHPWFAHYTKTGRTDPMAISELLTLREWHRHPLYQDVFRLWDVEDQLAGFVMNDNQWMVGLSASFGRSGAAGNHQAFMFKAGRMVGGAYSKVEHRRGLSSVEHALSDATVLSGAAVILLDRHERVDFSGGGLLESLRSEVGLIARGHKLPADLRHAIDTWKNGAGHTNGSTRLRGFNIRILRVDPKVDGYALLIDQRSTTEKVDALSPNALRTIELLGEGMNNHQVARELGLSVDTVRTYRTRALKVLGVHKIEVAVAMVTTWRQTHD